jgi:hypothetical protein
VTDRHDKSFRNLLVAERNAAWEERNALLSEVASLKHRLTALERSRVPPHCRTCGCDFWNQAESEA